MGRFGYVVKGELVYRAVWGYLGFVLYPRLRFLVFFFTRDSNFSYRVVFRAVRVCHVVWCNARLVVGYFRVNEKRWLPVVFFRLRGLVLPLSSVQNSGVVRFSFSRVERGLYLGGILLYRGDVTFCS